MVKNQADGKQHPDAELLTDISKKQVCLYQWDIMIHCNKSENDKDKIDHINKTYRGQDADIKTNTENIVCLGKTMSLCNNQHLSNIWGSTC